MADLKEIHRMLGGIEAKQDSMASDIGEIKKTVKHHEALKNYILGICAVISAGVGYLTSKING